MHARVWEGDGGGQSYFRCDDVLAKFSGQKEGETNDRKALQRGCWVSLLFQVHGGVTREDPRDSGEDPLTLMR